ncbi:Acyl-CoA dehydrogenase, short-chain specific [Fusobacterium sp. DD29]|uniref:acyl-CoA dehydrogenase family protein n=1 Tax=unclassified Fusobacterium TaxID=2648384 RepID=UPI001B8B0322|nr:MULTISPECIES: acyl-CoA dehydrogenase family protein [unclassified Fusobacterium]MBR8702305.1 Acyl-CoA dehydrogenase, short-chain specific [Fusobacterium sp. DD45]MBR8712122.1 Acyl-CoA dehydrogenase, short-chain specific [Fusobacterium sp. DD28]MBR8750036.1 Acyl-CoA dehydrogenase, short-chain specific [Fusobacterium sp. DD29]MBR8752701.1 Acyl-CoA dehydrogenase, short-chain specific [Fusobacterium sp. DD26]MBR8762284.1 Acyl-CoA dehydrogenase, short-chain specific [Fusobacterium sp. DD25]
MNFKFSEEQKLFLDKVSQIAKKDVAPMAAQTDKEARFPKEVIEKLAHEGIMGIPFDKKYGGLGMNNETYAAAVEELSKVCASTGVIMSAHTSLCAWPIATYGNESQKEKYLVPLATGKKIGAFGWTEAEAGTRTTAIKEGKNYILNGKKVLITNSHEAEIFVVFAKTDFEKNTLTAFILEKGTEGFSVGEAEDKMGVRGSSTAELHFNNCIIPEENILGNVGEGLKVAMTTLNGGRIGVAAQAVGIAQGALDAAIDYVKSRMQMGQPISHHQNIQFTIADLQTKIDAARLMVQRAANAKDANEDYGYMASMAKLFASEVAMETTTKAVQLFGGNGYSKKFPVERMMRDAKITEIYEGTSEVQKVVIAGHMNIK